MHPTDGRLGRMDIHPGTLVSREQSTALTILSRSDPLIVNFTMTEKEFFRLPKEALALEVNLLCNTECKSPGMITFLDSSFDTLSGLLNVRGEFRNEGNQFFAGQTVNVRLPIVTLPQVSLIPQKAVKYSQEGPYVYIVSAEKCIELRPLMLGEEEGEEVIVRNGLIPQDLVVISGHGRLSPGCKVDVQQ